MAALLGCPSAARARSSHLYSDRERGDGGAGGLYTLATSDMLAHAPRGTVPAMTGFTTLTQSLVYIAVNPIIGRAVQHFGNYDWVLVGRECGSCQGVFTGCYRLRRNVRQERPN